MFKCLVCSIYLSILMTGLVQCEQKEYKTLKVCDPNSSDLNECLAEAIQSALRNANNGESPIKVSFDPLHIDSVKINSDGNVSIKLDITNLEITGISNSTVENVDTDWEEFNFDTIIKEMKVNGKCKIDGQVLGTEINGDGPCYFEFTNMKTTSILTLKQLQKNGEKYYQITSFEFEIKADGMKINFKNLYDGNEILGNQTNQFLNANWKNILQEINQALSAGFGPIFKDIGNQVFKELPVNEITPSNK